MSNLLKGIIPIEKKFLQRNTSFAIEFREGFLFGRTVRKRIVQYKPWGLIDTDGTIIDISPSSTQAELRFNDPRNTVNDILYLDSTMNAGFPWFLHGAFGIKPQYINMYLRFPEGDEIPGKFPNINPIRPAAGDTITNLNGLSSPYEQPTDYHEVIIPPLIHIAAEYYNLDEVRSLQPVINIYFCLYWVQFFTAVTHPTLIADIALKRYEGARATFFTVGHGDLPHDLGPGLMQDWHVEPMSLDEAAGLGGS